MTAQLTGDELEELKRDWTTRQLDLASRAIFVDSDLTFQVNASEPHHIDAPELDFCQPRVSHAIDEVTGLTCVGGLDISFVPASYGRNNEAIATLAVLDFPKLDVRAASNVIDVANLPHASRSSASSRAESP